MPSELWTKHLQGTNQDSTTSADLCSLERRIVEIYWTWKETPTGTVALDDLLALVKEAKSLGVTEIECNTSYRQDYMGFCNTTELESDEKLVQRIRRGYRQCQMADWVNPEFVQFKIKQAQYELEQAELGVKYGFRKQEMVDERRRLVTSVEQERANAEQQLATARSAWKQLQEMGLVSVNDNGES